MRERWLMIAAVVGLVGAAVVWQWPVSPVWQRTGAIDGEVLRFGPDDRTLYTAEGLTGRGTGSGAVPRTPRLCKWDAATGELLNTVSISCTAVIPRGVTLLSPDARVLLICQPESATNNGSWTWLLFDAETGQQRGAPLGDVRYPCTANFSCDGRWLWLRHGSKSKGLDGVDIVATENAKRVVKVRGNEGEIPVNCCFSPHGSVAAIEYLGGSTAKIRIVELPSGREIRQFDLATRKGTRVAEWTEWVGDRLYATVEGPNGPKGYLWECYSFDLSAESIGEGTLEPLLGGRRDALKIQVYWDRGPGWVAQLSSGQEPWEKWIHWLGAKLGFKLNSRREQDYVLRFLNADTGRLRYEFPIPVDFPRAISRDGKRFARVGIFGVVEVWDVDPPARWPWVLMAGIVGAGLTLVFGRWRSRTKATSARVDA
jgi:hypothetical protein